MLSHFQVRRYSLESGLRNGTGIAENEIVLTYLLQLMTERGILEKFAFKGGTCLRKMIFGSDGRFSTDLDFTATGADDPDDSILEMMEAFQHPFHGIRFAIPDHGYYETQDGLSWAVHPIYSHGWNSDGESEIRLQVSRRERPTLPLLRMAQCPQNYFRHLPFKPADITCLAVPEIISEKLRASYQRAKARDIYDLATFARRPMNLPLVRRLVVLKLWQSGTAFDPDVLLNRFRDAGNLDWDDLRSLVHRSQGIDPDRMVAACADGFAFLRDLDSEELLLASDPHGQKLPLWQRLSEDTRALYESAQDVSDSYEP